MDPETRAALIARLHQQRAAGGLTTAEVRRASAGLAVAERTVWRWLAAEACTDRTETGYQLTEQDRDDYFSWRGNVAGLWRARRDAGAEGLPALRTMQRAFARQRRPSYVSLGSVA